MKFHGELQWDLKELEKALKIGDQHILEYFKDGRRVSFVIERRLAEMLGGVIADSENSGYDIKDKKNQKWEVRSLTKKIYFCPSYMIGSGRNFTEEGFISKLKEIHGYIVADVLQFPTVPYWMLEKEQILTWYDNQELGKNTNISRQKFLELIK